MFVLDLYIMYDVYTWLVGDMEQVPRRVNGLSYPLSIFGDSGFSLECRFHWLKLIEETHSVALGLSCSLCWFGSYLELNLILLSVYGMYGYFCNDHTMIVFYFHKLIVFYTHRIYTNMTWFFFMGSMFVKNTSFMDPIWVDNIYIYTCLTNSYPNFPVPPGAVVT